MNKVTVLNRTTRKILLVFYFVIALWSCQGEIKHLRKSKDTLNLPGHVKDGENTCYIMRRHQ